MGLLKTAATIAQIAALVPAAYCAYAAWMSLHPNETDIGLHMVTPEAVLVAIGALFALLGIGIVGIISAMKQIKELTAAYDEKNRAASALDGAIGHKNETIVELKERVARLTRQLSGADGGTEADHNI